jgi:hypothetical protein
MAGRIAHAITFTDEVTTTGSATQLYPLGTLRMEETSLGVGVECYRYVKCDASDVATVAGGLAYRGTSGGSNTISNPWVVTMDVSDATGGFCCGVFQSVLGDTKFGWIKTKGFQANLLKTFGAALNWTAGVMIVAGTAASQDGMAKRFTSASTGGSKVSQTEIRLQKYVGWALSTAVSTTHVGKAFIDLE